MAVAVKPKLTETQAQVLGALKEGPAQSRREVYDRAGDRIANVTRVLRGLADRGLINYTHDLPGERFRASLTPKGRSAIR